MRWNKITAVFLLGLAGAACDRPPDPRIINSASGANNLSVNVYNGYPGPNRPSNANVKANRNVNANATDSNANAPSVHSANLPPSKTP